MFFSPWCCEDDEILGAKDGAWDLLIESSGLFCVIEVSESDGGAFIRVVASLPVGTANGALELRCCC